MIKVISTLVLGGLLAHYGVTGMAPQGEQAAAVPQGAVAVVEEVPDSEAASLPPAGMSVRSELASDVETGVTHIDSSMRQLPGYFVKVAGQVEQHGIAALAYDDPESKTMAQRIGQDLGQGIAAIASAVGKDLVAASQNRAVN